MKKSNFYILLYFTVITAVALLSSCATTTHSCQDSFRPKIRENYNPRGTNWW
jgi:hypothetical protein